MAVTLNGNTYDNDDFLGEGYKTLFPNPIFNDFLAEADARKDAVATEGENQIDAIGIAADLAIADLAGARNTTSTSSLTIGTGSKSFVVADNRSYPNGSDYKAVNPSDTTKWMVGVVTGYDAGTQTLTLNVATSNGSGSVSSWNLIFTGPQGPAGLGTPASTSSPDIADSTAVVGSSSEYARRDHVHAHGNRGGGSLHSLATTSTAGFMEANAVKTLNMFLGAETTVAVDTSCIAWTRYRVTSNKTMTLPTMAAGEALIIERDTTAGNVTIGRNSQTIDSVSADFVIDVNKVALLLSCTGTGAIRTRYIGNLAL